VPHVGRTTWRWNVPVRDSTDATGRGGVHGSAGPIGPRETENRKNPATQSPAAPKIGGASTKNMTTPTIGDRKKEMPASSKPTSRTTKPKTKPAGSTPAILFNGEPKPPGNGRVCDADQEHQDRDRDGEANQETEDDQERREEDPSENQQE